MSTKDLAIAKSRLRDKRLTLCIVKEQQILFESKSHGLAGFVETVGRFKDRLERSSVADKVVGKAVALLLVYAKVGAVYATTLSKRAEAVLDKNSVYLEYDDLVENILGLGGKGDCPFEQLVSTISDPVKAYRNLKSACYSKRRFKPPDEKHEC